MICPLGLIHSKKIECIEGECVLCTRHENNEYECAIRVFLLTPFLAWNKEREELQKSDEYINKKGSDNIPYR